MAFLVLADGIEIELDSSMTSRYSWGWFWGSTYPEFVSVSMIGSCSFSYSWSCLCRLVYPASPSFVMDIAGLVNPSWRLCPESTMNGSWALWSPVLPVLCTADNSGDDVCIAFFLRHNHKISDQKNICINIPPLVVFKPLKLHVIFHIIYLLHSIKITSGSTKNRKTATAITPHLELSETEKLGIFLRYHVHENIF